MELFWSFTWRVQVFGIWLVLYRLSNLLNDPVFMQHWLTIPSLIFKKRQSLQLPQLFQYNSAPRLLLIGLVADRLYRFLSFFWAAYTVNKLRQFFWLFLTDCQSGGSSEPFRLPPVVFPFSAYI